MDTETASRKVRNLLRIADNDPGPQGRTAQRKAEELMAKYGLELSEEEEDVEETFKVGLNDRSWAFLLLAYLAEKDGCTFGCYWTTAGGFFQVSGERLKVESVRYHYFNWLDVFDELAGGAASRHFRLGCVYGIQEREKRKQQAENIIRNFQFWRPENRSLVRQTHKIKKNANGETVQVHIAGPGSVQFVGGKASRPQAHPHEQSRNNEQGQDEQGQDLGLEIPPEKDYDWALVSRACALMIRWLMTHRSRAR